MLLPLCALLGVLALVIMACGGSSANAGTNVGTNGNSTTTSGSSTSNKHFKVGDQVKVGDTFIVTVNSFKTNPGDDIFKPKTGNKFVVVDVSLKNVGSDEQDISSLLQFTLKDATGQKYNETIISNVTPPDGKLATGDIIKGQIAYEVAASQHDFTFAFEADIISSGQTVWDLHV
ncbi:MAG TPA: DUF4352 domain-containing protein [Ktedonobacterales bacterium]|nr:DUF4352 domain-containing protein [Ktedonobacterales bacterium]